MFRDMRRKNQQMSEEEAINILTSLSYGVLGLVGDGGYPYTVPLNYVFCDGKLYFHCASEGHKIDSVKNDDRASFCVVAKDDVVPSMLATDFCSVILFGRVGFVSGDDEKRRVLLQFVELFYNQNHLPFYPPPLSSTQNMSESQNFARRAIVNYPSKD